MQEFPQDDGTVIIEPGSSAEAEKSSVRIIKAGTIAANKTVDFTKAGVYVCTTSAPLALNVESLGIGQTGRIVATGAVGLTFVGVDVWLNGSHTGSGGALFVFEMFNTGETVIGKWTQETGEDYALASHDHES